MEASHLQIRPPKCRLSRSPRTRRSKLRKLGAERTVAARKFFEGLYQTARRDDELITEIVFPASTANEVFGFSEFSRRHGDFAVVGVIVRARKSGDGLSDRRKS